MKDKREKERNRKKVERKSKTAVSSNKGGGGGEGVEQSRLDKPELGLGMSREVSAVKHEREERR